MLERIFASIEDEESTAGTNDWRARIEGAAPDDRLAVICQAVREVVGSVLRVKADSLRDDQPLTDLGLDSLMGVEIETSLESAVGVALPATSLMRARTIGQIGVLIAGHMGSSATPSPVAPAVSVESNVVEEVDLESISDDEIDQLFADDETEDLEEATS